MVKNETWIVGVSGGADSMALIDMYKNKYQCIVAHVNYHKRDDSNLDEALVRDYCYKNNLICCVRDYVDSTGNFQKDAREFRYQFYKELIEMYNAKGVMIAHHLNDSMETYLFHKERNSLSETIGIKEKGKVLEVEVYRPFLNIFKKDLYAYNHQHNIPYREDSSNTNTSYTRNKIRQSLSKMDSNEIEVLKHDMEQEQKEWDTKIERLRKDINSLKAEISLDTFKKLDKDYGVLFLREWLLNAGVDAYSFSHKYLLNIRELILEEVCDMWFNNIYLSSSYGVVWLGMIDTYTFGMEREETPWYTLEKHGDTIQGLTLKVEDMPIIIRSPKEQDSIEMRFGRKKLNRFFIDRKIPLHQRYQWTVVENKEGKVIFVSKLGCDKDHYSSKPSLYIKEKY